MSQLQNVLYKYVERSDGNTDGTQRHHILRICFRFMACGKCCKHFFLFAVEDSCVLAGLMLNIRQRIGNVLGG